jgi:hypothetical protein
MWSAPRLVRGGQRRRGEHYRQRRGTIRLLLRLVFIDSHMTVRDDAAHKPEALAKVLR